MCVTLNLWMLVISPAASASRDKTQENPRALEWIEWSFCSETSEYYLFHEWKSSHCILNLGDNTHEVHSILCGAPRGLKVGLSTSIYLIILDPVTGTQ